MICRAEPPARYFPVLSRVVLSHITFCVLQYSTASGLPQPRNVHDYHISQDQLSQYYNFAAYLLGYQREGTPFIVDCTNLTLLELLIRGLNTPRNVNGHQRPPPFSNKNNNDNNDCPATNAHFDTPRHQHSPAIITTSPVSTRSIASLGLPPAHRYRAPRRIC